MIVCSACGAQNRDDVRFCGDCGAFLEWEGAPASSSAATSVAASASSVAAAPTVVADQDAGPGAPATGPGASAAGPAPVPPAAGSVPVSPAPAVPEPVSPAPVVPAPVQPGEAPRRRATPPPPQEVRRAPLPGELVCQSCGSGSERGRRFCRSCGAVLTQAAAARLPWWRRLLRRLFRRRNYAAGQRRQRRVQRATRPLWIVIAVLCLLAVAVVALPLIIRGINSLKDKTSAHVPIRPDGFAASSFLSDTPPTNISDGASNRYWAPRGKAAGSWVEASFAKPVRLLDIVITPGVATDQEQFLKHARPHELDVVATAKNGTTSTKTFTLRDEPGPQNFDYEAPDTVRVRLLVKSTYGPGGSPSVAIGELEFFGRN